MNEIPDYRRYGEKVPPQNPIYFPEGRRYPPKLPEPPPTYIIIDSPPRRKPFGAIGPPHPRPPGHGFVEGRHHTHGGSPGFYGPTGPEGKETYPGFTKNPFNSILPPFSLLPKSPGRIQRGPEIRQSVPRHADRTRL